MVVLVGFSVIKMLPVAERRFSSIIFVQAHSQFVQNWPPSVRMSYGGRSRHQPLTQIADDKAVAAVTWEIGLY